MKLIPGLLIICFFLCSTPSKAQSDSSFYSHAAHSLSKWLEVNPAEKVYLHLDKPYYAAGDDIWFKAYVTSGYKHELSGISGILNVELINDKDFVEQYIKLPLVIGLTWGDFKLPDTLSAGNYRIVAYTNWMRNAGPAYFYDRTISIGNALFPDVRPDNNDKRRHTKYVRREAGTEKSGQPKIDVQFFPEGGNLVYGISSKVAFKAVGDDGLGKNIKGVIMDEGNHEITRFSSTHLGMGVFSFLPISGKKYKAVVTYPDGSENSVNLPEPAVSGCILHINDLDSSNIYVNIEVSKDQLNENKGINLIAQSEGEIYYASMSKSMKTSFSAVIPKNKFPSGIVQFTLFSSDGEPLNERLVFVQNADRLKLSLPAIKETYAPREKMKVDLNVENVQGKPVPGNFSVAVIDETKVPVDEADEPSIFSNLLLTSDLRGYVEKPGYYFNPVNQQAKEDLDVLMLTQGYRRFEWKRVLSDNFAPVAYPPESSFEISGHVKTLSGKPVARGIVSLLSSSRGLFLVDTLTNDKGYFAFKNLQFKDSVKFVLQAKTSKNKSNVEITPDTTGQAPVVPAQRLPGRRVNIDTVRSTYLVNSKKVYDEEVRSGIGNHVMALKEVKIKETKILPNSSNLNGPGNADQVLLAKDISTGCASIADCLQGKLTGVFFKYDTYGVGYPCTNMDGHTVVMKIMVDGFIMSPENLNTLPVESVESVEVLRNSSFTSIYGSDGYNGLILINTKKGNYGTIASKPNILMFTPKGYYKAREFYSPQYDDPKTNAPLADLRTTIYWNPDVATDKKGKSSFGYFNAGTKGTYRIVIEGIDGNGNLGRLVYHYKVE